MSDEMPTRKQAIETHCWECLGHYDDGRTDCGNTTCPLYTYMPYRQKEPDLELFRYDPKRCGLILKKVMSDEEKKALLDRLSKNAQE